MLDLLMFDFQLIHMYILLNCHFVSDTQNDVLYVIFTLSFYLFESNREREKPESHVTPWLCQVEAWSWELNLCLPHGWQRAMACFLQDIYQQEAEIRVESELKFLTLLCVVDISSGVSPTIPTVCPRSQIFLMLELFCHLERLGYIVYMLIYLYNPAHSARKRLIGCLKLQQNQTTPRLGMFTYREDV